jgi:hypothetical protein
MTAIFPPPGTASGTYHWIQHAPDDGPPAAPVPAMWSQEGKWWMVGHGRPLYAVDLGEKSWRWVAALPLYKEPFCFKRVRGGSSDC